MKLSAKPKIKDLLFILLFFCLLLIFLYPILNLKDIIYSGDLSGSDLTELNVPFRFLLQKSLQQGKIPLWTNLLSTGFTLLAEGQTGIFYPLNIFLFYFLPMASALNIGLLLNFLLAGIFLYIFARSLNISRWGALFAAIAFSFSGFFIFKIKHLNIINAAIWLPLEFYLINKYFQARKKSLIIAILSVVFAIQFFAGHPQIFYISVVSSIMYFLCIFFTLDELKANFIKLIIPWLIIGAIVFGLIAVQFFPSCELLILAYRSQWIDYKTATMFKYHPANLITFIFPYFFGNPANNTYLQNIISFGVFWESNIYLGFLAFIFSLVAIFLLFKEKRQVKLFVFLLFFSFIFIFSGYLNVFRIFWHITPGLQYFRFYQRFLLLSLLCLAILAGFGFDYFFKKVKNFIISKEALKNSRYIFSFLNIAAIFFLFTDLFIVHSEYNNYINYDKYFSPPKSALLLKEDRDVFRIYSDSWRDVWPNINRISGGWQNNLELFYENRELIPPNLNAIWGLAGIDDRGLFEGGIGGIQWYSDLQKEGLFKIDLGNLEHNDEITQFLKIIGMQNVKYILSFRELVHDDLVFVNSIKLNYLPPLSIYENKHYLPLAYMVFNAKELKQEEVLSTMFSPDFDPQNEIIITESINYKSDSDVSPAAKIDIIINEDDNLEIEVDSISDGFLFVSNVYYPGWQAFIDGVAEKILKANHAFQAIKIPKGKHQVSLRYNPSSYQIGKLITLTTIILLIIYFIFIFIRSHKKINN